MRTVVILALQGVVPSDLGIPCDVFGRVLDAGGAPAYGVRVAGEAARVSAGAFEIRVRFGLAALADADMVVVPGIENARRPQSAAVTRALRAASERGALVTSICTGAFVLAAAGLLDGRRATTHWAAAEELARRYPAVSVDPGVLFVDDGSIVTSAGASAGLDMCLHLVRRHHGQAIAAHAARLAVAPLHRDGGQAQFIHQQAPAPRDSLAGVVDWMVAHLDQPLDVATLAAQACMTPRTFARRFRDQTGTTPIQWLLRQRIRRAQEWLETGPASIEQIAAATGFDSPVTFRARFQRFVGVSPSVYRKRFSRPV
ncbi:GlxA family transcriptional regulator [Burkholderia sp. 22PA0106]|uniref:GlxA family transcriptional regulator n=1 Tax=Burkholderia sp. 22PA0106 TaxID=3237371 RepID=UPI0039C4BA0C